MASVSTSISSQQFVAGHHEPTTDSDHPFVHWNALRDLHGSMSRFVGGILGHDHCETDDVIGGAIGRSWFSLRHKYPVETSPAPVEEVVKLVTTAARNAALDVMRSNSRRNTYSLFDGDDKATELEDKTPIRQCNTLDLDEVSPRMREALETLSPAERLAFRLRFEEGLTHREIAQRTLSNEGAAQRTYSRAVRKLQKALSNHPGLH